VDYAKMWRKGLKRLKPVIESDWFKQQMRDFVWRNYK